MNRKRGLHQISEAYRNIFYGDLPVKITVLDVYIDKELGEATYNIRLQNKEPHEKWYKSLREQYADITIVKYLDDSKRPVYYSFEDLIDSKYLGQYEDAYKTAYRWWEIHRKEIIEFLEKDYLERTMRPRSREAFGDILRNLDESRNRDKYIFFLRVMRSVENKYASEEKATYRYKKVSDMTDEDKRLLKLMKPYKSTPGIKSYELQSYNDGTTRYRLAFIGNLNDIKDIIKTYKGTFKVFEEELPLKPETKKHFGGIFAALEESIKERNKEKFVFLIKIYYPRGEETPFADYKHIRLEGLSEKDKDIMKKLSRNSNAYFGHGKYEDDKEMLIRMGDNIGKYSKIIAVIGPKNKVNEEFQRFLKHIYGTRMREEIDIKPKTREHFEDIFRNI